jgi:hypothetical protein
LQCISAPEQGTAFLIHIPIQQPSWSHYLPTSDNEGEDEGL